MREQGKAGLWKKKRKRERRKGVEIVADRQVEIKLT